jgi:hypothetical protein
METYVVSHDPPPPAKKKKNYNTKKKKSIIPGNSKPQFPIRFKKSTPEVEIMISGYKKKICWHFEHEICSYAEGDESLFLRKKGVEKNQTPQATK